MALPPIEGVEVDRRSGDGTSRPAGEDEDFGASPDVRGPDAGGPAALALDQDQVAEDDAEPDGLVIGAGEILPGGNGDNIQTRREALGHVGEGAVVAVVRALGEVGLPRGFRPPPLGDLSGFVPLGEEVVVFRRLDQRLDVEGVGAEEQAVEVTVGDADGAASGRVDAHRFDGVLGRLDRLEDVEAAQPAGGLRESLHPFDGDLSGPDERVGDVLFARVFGEEGLPDGPPGVLAIGGQEIGQMPADEGPAVLAVERFVERLDELEARFEGRFGPAGAAAPSLVFAEQGGGFFERVARDGFEDAGGVRGVRFPGLREELGQVEEPGLVRLARRPEAGVGEEPGHEVDDPVAQGIAHACRVIARAPEVGEFSGLAPGQTFPVLPDADEGLPGLVEDLVPGPGLEVDGALGLDALAAVYFPGVGVVVNDEGMAEEKIEHVALERGVGPRLFLEEPDRGLVAVEGGAELAFLDERPGPEGIVAGLPGLFADAGGFGGGGFEFLLVDELVDGLAGGLELRLGLRIGGHGCGRRRHRSRNPASATARPGGEGHPQKASRRCEPSARLESEPRRTW